MLLAETSGFFVPQPSRTRYEVSLPNQPRNGAANELGGSNLPENCGVPALRPAHLRTNSSDRPVGLGNLQANITQDTPVQSGDGQTSGSRHPRGVVLS